MKYCVTCGSELRRDSLEGLCPRCVARAAFGQAAPSEPEEEEPAGNAHSTIEVQADAVIERTGVRIGRYKLLETIGEGGFGTVYMAEQLEPVRRRVAVKIIKAGMDTKEVVARFEAERQALAMMDHPNIARVLDGGTTTAGRPYFVMELVRGIRITDYCDQSKLPISERLNLFVKVCQAIQHAHQKGIIHRDIKPSNILVTLHDTEPVPKVIDFGVAKALGQKLTERTLFTGYANMIGTPAYMSPEQAEMSALDVDTRSDIYSLGVLLYELLTGVTPFDKETLAKAGLDEIRRLIREAEPPKPSTRLHTMGQKITDVAHQRRTEAPALNRLVRGDLDWIVMKCLEKDRARRYETANAVANDIERHLLHEPIEACPPSPVYLVRKFIRRNRVAVGVIGIVFVALAVGLASALLGLQQARRAGSRERAQRQTAEAERARADKLRQTAENQAAQIGEQLYASEMNMGLKAWENGDLGAALSALDRYLPKTGEEDLRGFEWYYLWRLCHSEELSLLEHKQQVRAVEFSPDGRRLFTGGDDSQVRVWDAEDGRQLGILSGHTNLIGGVACAPDGKLVATTGGDRLVRLWDAQTLREVGQLRGLVDAGSCVEFSPDGRLVAAGSARLVSGPGNPVERFISQEPTESKVILWRVADREQMSILEGHRAGVQALAFAPDGKTLATGSATGELMLWDLPQGERRGTGRNLGVPILALAFSSTGRDLAVGGGNPRKRETLLKLLDVATGREVRDLDTHRGPVFTLGFSARDKHLASAGLDQIVRLWDVATGKETASFKGHSGVIWSLSFDRSGQRLASASWDTTVKVWHLGHSQHATLYKGPGGYCLSFAPDSTHLAQSNRRIFIQKVGSSEPAFPLPGYETPDVSLSWSPDGELLASAGNDGQVTIWETRQWRKLRELKGNEVKIWSVAFSPDGETLAAGSDIADPQLHLWDTTTWRKRAALRSHGSSVACLAFTPDGKNLVAGSWFEIVCVDPATAKELWRINEPGPRVAISPDGKWCVATARGRPSTIRMFDFATRQVRWIVPAHNDIIWAVAFSPDGKTLATSSWDGSAKLWHAPSGQEILRYNTSGVSWGAAFSRDGRYFAVGSGSWEDPELAVFRAATRAEVFRNLPRTEGVPGWQ